MQQHALRPQLHECTQHPHLNSRPQPPQQLLTPFLRVARTRRAAVFLQYSSAVASRLPPLLVVEACQPPAG